MKTTINLLLAILTLALFLPANALARDVYPEKSMSDIYVLSTERGGALLKAKGAKKEYVAVGDVISEDRMIVVKIDGLSITVKSEYGDIAAKLPVGGGVGY